MHLAHGRRWDLPSTGTSRMRNLDSMWRCRIMVRAWLLGCLKLARDVGVYDFIDGEWELMPPPAGLSSTLTIPGTNSGDELGKQLSISADGTRLAIAGPMHDGNFANSGHVQVYDYSGGS